MQTFQYLTKAKIMWHWVYLFALYYYPNCLLCPLEIVN